jgi:hypothetical protein
MDDQITHHSSVSYPVHQIRKLAFKTIHSTTKLLPAWYTILSTLKMKRRNIPRDVATRWNSTFDMLNFVLDYKIAIEQYTQERGLGLREYELSDEEWKLAVELRNVLKVSFPCDLSPIFRSRNPLPRPNPNLCLYGKHPFPSVFSCHRTPSIY